MVGFWRCMGLSLGLMVLWGVGFVIWGVANPVGDPTYIPYADPKNLAMPLLLWIPGAFVARRWYSRGEIASAALGVLLLPVGLVAGSLAVESVVGGDTLQGPGLPLLGAILAGGCALVGPALIWTRWRR